MIKIGSKQNQISYPTEADCESTKVRQDSLPGTFYETIKLY